MKIETILFEPESYLVCLEGDLTRHTAPKIEKLFQKLVEIGAERIIVDMAHVHLADPQGVNSLVFGLHLFGGYVENFRLMSVNLQPQLMLTVTGVDYLFWLGDSWLMMDEQFRAN